ncbi:ZP domain-containing protein-like [Diadema setosum]|uniref:ZP domain-containing protein-like n=1 Tax=Diadema setosum TaxID=31175 RepID=UPI003B3B03F7
MNIDSLNAEPENVVETQIIAIRGLAFNHEGTKMYWLDYEANRIESLDLLSGERTLLLTRRGFFGLAWHNGDIYLTEIFLDVIAIMNDTSGEVRYVGPRIFASAYDICVVSSLKDPSQWTCDFDNFGSNLCGWSQDFQDDFDWLRLPRNASRQSENDPSVGDYSMFINGTTQFDGARANFTSPYTNTVSATATCFRFAFIMPGASNDTMLKLHFTNQSFSSVIWVKRGDQGAFWQLADVVISGLGEGHFVFEGVVGTPERSVIGVDDVRFGPCDDQYDAPKVSCDNGRMEILLKRENYRVSAPSQIRFSRSRCYSYVVNSDYVALSTSFEECGTRIASDEENFFFTNEIEDVSGVMQSFVVNCTVRRRQLIHTSYIAQSSVSVFTMVFGLGNFTIAIRQFTSQTFDVALPEPALPQQVFEGNTIYLGTTIASLKNLYVFNERCWATPSPDPADRSYRDLIENGLAVSTNVEIYDIINSTVRAFSVRTFKINRVTDVTYIHCNVLVCQQNDRLESCHTSDRSVPRAKRYSNGNPANAYLLSSGPFFLKNDKGISVSSVAVYLTLSAMFMMLACIASLVGVILYQRRRITRN